MMFDEEVKSHAFDGPVGSNARVDYSLTAERAGARLRTARPYIEKHVRKDRDSRQPRKRGFDDESYTPPERFGFAPRVGEPRFESSPTGPTVQGTVKFYAADKGFGCIVRERGGKDIFVHASALSRAGITDLVEGQRVAVDMVEGGKGPEAVNIRLI